MEVSQWNQSQFLLKDDIKKYVQLD
jgi:hypothetical protein